MRRKAATRGRASATDCPCRILRTRAKFDRWGATFILDCDDELVDQEQLETWLDIGGRRIGLGDWRPEKSGHFGRFAVQSVSRLG